MPVSPRPLNLQSLQTLLAPRDPASHKGSFGHVLVVGGDEGLGGAALMAAEAAARTGAGLVSVATHPAHAAAFLVRRPELMVKAAGDPNVINAIGERATAVVLGPGLGLSAWSEACFAATLRLVRDRDLPVVIDADGLNLIAKDSSIFLSTGISKHILTPHPGEAARLLQVPNQAEARDRPAIAESLQNQYGGVAVLKGAGTIVCHVLNGRLQLDCCQHGNPGMATGGMGDVLSGIIAGLLAQGHSTADAARLGVCLHSRAADLQAEAHGERGLLATDLFASLRTLLNP